MKRLATHEIKIKDLQLLAIARRDLLVGGFGASACAMVIPAVCDLRPQKIFIFSGRRS